MRDDTDVKASDLVTDEAVWDLYKSWCLYHRIHRAQEEMERRFSTFKKWAIEVYQVNNMNLKYTYGMNEFALIT